MFKNLYIWHIVSMTFLSSYYIYTNIVGEIL